MFFDEEPLSDKSELWEFDNVYLTPHNSYYSNLNKDKLFAQIIKKTLESLIKVKNKEIIILYGHLAKEKKPFNF